MAYTYAYICIHIYVYYIYVYIYIKSYMTAYIHIYIWIQTYTYCIYCIYTYIYEYKQKHENVYTYTLSQVYIYIYIYIYIYQLEMGNGISTSRSHSLHFVVIYLEKNVIWSFLTSSTVDKNSNFDLNSLLFSGNQFKSRTTQKSISWNAFAKNEFTLTYRLIEKKAINVVCNTSSSNKDDLPTNHELKLMYCID